jgi:hypothetical protein
MLMCHAEMHGLQHCCIDVPWAGCASCGCRMVVHSCMQAAVQRRAWPGTVLSVQSGVCIALCKQAVPVEQLVCTVCMSGLGAGLVMCAVLIVLLDGS